MLTRTALTHGSTEGHRKATSVLHFSYYKKKPVAPNLFLVPPAVLHSGQVSHTHTHTKSTLKQHNKIKFISKALYLLNSNRWGISFHTLKRVLKSNLTNYNLIRPIIHHIKPNYAALSLPLSRILLDLSVQGTMLIKHVLVTTLSFPV